MANSRLSLVISFSKELAEGPSGSGSAMRNWSFIRNLKLPPKIRMFLWRACFNILPTKLALFRRHVAANPFCDQCGVEEESITLCVICVP